jgi:hypothetical protein
MALGHLGTFTYVTARTLRYPHLELLVSCRRGGIGFQHTPLVPMDSLHRGQSKNLILELVLKGPLYGLGEVVCNHLLCRTVLNCNLFLGDLIGDEKVRNIYISLFFNRWTLSHYVPASWCFDCLDRGCCQYLSPVLPRNNSSWLQSSFWCSSFVSANISIWLLHPST